ncbi:MAG TPA: hypothetical protein VE170_14030 [Candidatus Limnocylindria bacterium]|nr:hypothetical protein [Candidatus Limnocylindria bacterium]
MTVSSEPKATETDQTKQLAQLALHEKKSKCNDKEWGGTKLICREEAKTAEAILTDQLTRAGVVNIDKHVFFRMAGKEPRKNFDEIFFSLVVGVYEAFADVKLVRSFAAIESDPETGAIGARLI